MNLRRASLAWSGFAFGRPGSARLLQRLGRSRTLVLVLAVIGFCGHAAAQSTLYDPTNPLGSPYSTGQSGSGQTTTGQGGANGAYGGANGAYTTPTPPGDTGFSPTVLPSVSDSPLGATSNGTNAGTGVLGVNGEVGTTDGATSLVTRPTASGIIGRPLYVRPGSVPGQFQLYAKPPPQPGEFELFVEKSLGRRLPRFGESLILNGGRGFTTPPTTTVPPDYRLNPGDQLIIGVTGSVEASLRLVIDSEGRIFIPKIGEVDVAGVRYGDLQAALSRRFAEQYKQAHVSVVIGRLHGITVYVTGFAVTPGAYTISSLSTLVDAVLESGGPSAGGSFRRVELRRGGKLVTTLDLYDLLIRGDKTKDSSLQNEDVINIAPVGAQLAMIGSVNQEAIYEAKPGESLADMLAYAGGMDSLADESRLIVTRLSDLDKSGSEELTAAGARAVRAERGDLVRVLSLANIARPLERQSTIVTIEGEVDHPGRYYLRPGSTVGDLLARAGGLTAGAYLFGTQFDRESLRGQQQASFDRAIQELQFDAAASPLSDIRSAIDSGASAAARAQVAIAIIDRLKEQKPEGRLVLALAPDAASLPTSLMLENNDRIYVPPRPKTVGVFGAVYETGSFLYTPGLRLSAYLRLSGGPKRIAERGDIFVVRANGSVISARQTHNLGDQPAMPGDVIFVPVKTSAGAFEKLLLIAQVVSQFAVTGLTLAALGL